MRPKYNWEHLYPTTGTERLKDHGRILNTLAKGMRVTQPTNQTSRQTERMAKC